MASLVRAMVNGTAVVNATKVQELLNDVDAAMDWKNDALRYLWATASAGVDVHVVRVRGR